MNERLGVGVGVGIELKEGVGAVGGEADLAGSRERIVADEDEVLIAVLGVSVGIDPMQVEPIAVEEIEIGANDVGLAGDRAGFGNRPKQERVGAAAADQGILSE